MLCLNYLTRGSAPLDPRSCRRDQKSTFRNGWGKFCSIVPEGFSDGTDSPSWFQGNKTKKVRLVRVSVVPKDAKRFD